MSTNTQMNEEERGIFKLHGVIGMVIAVALLLTILVCLVFNAVSVQQRESSNYYQISKNLDDLKQNSKDNSKHYQLIGNGKKE